MQRFSKTTLLATVMLMDILGGAELDLFIPSFPELQTQFHLSPFWVETLLSINFIGFCLSLFIVGGLADKYGRKPIILSGLLIFILGSLSCLIATSYPFLIMGRFLQGLGVAAPATLCYLIIADAYPLKQQQFLMAMLNGLTNISIALAPVIGSYISLYFHWQGNFIALLALGIIVFIMTIWGIPTQTLPERHKATLSLRGYIPLFQSKPLMLMLTQLVFGAVTYYVFIGMSPILYMEDLGVSLSDFGFYQGALALIFALGSIGSGFIIHRFNQQNMLKISAHACVLSLIILAWVTWIDSPSPLLITLSLLPFSIAVAVPVTILAPVALNFIPHAKGRIAAVFQGARLIFMAIGLQIAGYYYQNSFQNIGIIITMCFLISIITLFMVIETPAVIEACAQES